MRPNLREVVRLWLAGLSLALLAALAPNPALAHAMLLSSIPASGAVLAESPQALILNFNEPVSPLALKLIDPAGAESDLTAGIAGGVEIRIPLAESPRGTQILTWRVVSEDGHPIAGSLLFSVGEASGASFDASSVAGDPLVRRLLWLTRTAALVGLVFGIGGALFGALAGIPPGATRPLAGLVLTGMAASLLFLGLHGLDALGLKLSALASAAPWAAGGSTSFGRSVALWSLAGAIALAALLWRPALGWIAALLLALGFAASGHAAAASPQILTRPMVALHGFALIFWTGALFPLALWLKRADGAAALRRFSAAIPYAVILLAGTGLGLAAIQLGPDPRTWPTPYGWILAAKLTLLAAVFALAALNRFALTAPALAGDSIAATKLRRAIRLEIGLILAVLALAAGWRFTPPPRALALVPAQIAPPLSAHFGTAEAMADLTISPGRAGEVAVEIFPYDGAMIPSEPLAITLGIAQEARGLHRMTYPATRGADGVWRVEPLLLPYGGVWEVDLDIRLTRFKRARISTTLALP